MNKLHIRIPSLIENIRIVEGFIENARQQFSLDEDTYGNIMIAVTEAVNNAIKHGNREAPSKNVYLTLTVQQSLLKCDIEDDGQGFSHHNLPDPTAPENIEKTSGRGVFLMKRLADEVSFSKGGRKVELSFYINA